MAVEEVEETGGAREATAVSDIAATDGPATEVGGPVAEAEALAASAVKYPIAPGYRVNVRSGPGTQYSIVRTLPYNARVPIYCQKAGQSVAGPYGTSNIWDNVANGEFVADAYVKTGSDGYVAPRCA